MQSLVPTDLQKIGDEPRVLDLRLAERLEFKAPRQIRELIERHGAELERYGKLICRTIRQNGRGRPASEFWLNEAQALLICMRSDAPRAEDVRAEIITVFQAYRRGELIPSSPSLKEIGQLFKTELEPVHRGMAELRRDSAQMRCEIVDMKGNLLEVQDRLNKVVKQTQFSKWARKQFVFVVHKRYQGFCPCCRDNKIVDEYGREIDTKSSHADHFHGPENNKVEDGWLVCAKCNYRLYRDPAFKEKAKPHFRVYQDYRFDIFGNGKQQSPRKQRQSKTVLHSKQFSMKFD